MTKKKKCELGIGELINQFESLPIQTVETFNKMFNKCKLVGYNPDLVVTIGNYNRGRRELIVGDNIIYHEFSLIDLTLGVYYEKPFILKYPDGKIIGRFDKKTEAANHLGILFSTFKDYYHSGKFIKEDLT